MGMHPDNRDAAHAAVWPTALASPCQPPGDAHGLFSLGTVQHKAFRATMQMMSPPRSRAATILSDQDLLQSRVELQGWEEKRRTHRLQTPLQSQAAYHVPGSLLESPSWSWGQSCTCVLWGLCWPCSASSPTDKRPETVTEQQGDASNLGNGKPFVRVCTLENASGKG